MLKKSKVRIMDTLDKAEASKIATFLALATRRIYKNIGKDGKFTKSFAKFKKGEKFQTYYND